jgi:anti-sigma factor RsiW
MNCREFEDLILESCEGAVSPAGRALLESHLAGCGECRAYFEMQKELDRLLARTLSPPALSPAFGKRLAARIAGQRQTPRFRRLPRVLDWIGYLSLAFLAGRLIQQLPHAGDWVALASVAGCMAFGLWETGKALRANFGHR